VRSRSAWLTWHLEQALDLPVPLQHGQPASGETDCGRDAWHGDEVPEVRQRYRCGTHRGSAGGAIVQCLDCGEIFDLRASALLTVSRGARLFEHYREGERSTTSQGEAITEGQ
jgi:hypothetical protein